jgi:uncharacterized membrane protein
MVIALAAAPLAYRGVAGRWPGERTDGDTRTALAGGRGVHVREAVRVERPVAEVYAFWRNLEHLPRFMSHLVSVSQLADGRSHWVAKGPVGMHVEWDAEIINEVENSVIGWQSLPGGDLVTAGSVTFEPVRGGRATQVSTHLQYTTRAGDSGRYLAAVAGRDPGSAIREDLRRFKQLLEAGEVPRASATEVTS